MIKKCGLDPLLLSGLRLTLAAAIIGPLFIRDWRRHRATLGWRDLAAPALPGMALALHFATWIYGARLTPVANSTLIVNLVPIATPLLLWAIVREKVTPREWVATGVAAIGLLILFFADFGINAGHFHGDLVCLGSMLLVAWYLVLGRKNRHHPTLWLYLAPLYVSAAAVSFLLAIFLADRSPIDWRAELPWVVAIAVVPTVLGHSLLNNAMRHFRGQVVALTNLIQVVFAALLAYPFLGEVPDLAFYPAGLAVLMAVLLATRAKVRPSAAESG